MKRYIGTKIILAIAMTRGDYNAKRGWTPPEGEDQTTEGYLVEYTDGGQPNHPDHAGYISWSPKEQFENAYRESGSMTFGHAVEALKLGKRVSREGWNGKDMFVFQQVPSEISIDIVPRMTSLPELVRAEFMRRGQPLRYSNQFALVKPDNSINGWTPSPADTLAEDWTILD